MTKKNISKFLMNSLYKRKQLYVEGKSSFVEFWILQLIWNCLSYIMLLGCYILTWRGQAKKYTVEPV